MKRLSLILLLGIICRFGIAQTPEPAEGGLVKWMSLDEAMKKEETQPRPMVVDFYTDWCGWCKHMMKTTYNSTELAQYINTNFYPVKFNAEGKDTIEYLGETYRPTSNQPKTTHPLANKLLQGQLVYPTTLFLNNYDKQKKEFGFSMIAQGFMESDKVEPILIFTLENVFRNSSYDDFKVQFHKAFYEKETKEKAQEINWKKPSEVFNNRDSTDKKMMVFVYTDWCNGCKVMKATSFNDSLSADYLKQKFDLVDFNLELNTDTLRLAGQTFINPHVTQSPFHQLALALCHNSLTLPSVVILDEKFKVLDDIPFYLNPKELKNIATFYGDDIYKKKSWKDFATDAANTKQ